MARLLDLETERTSSVLRADDTIKSDLGNTADSRRSFSMPRALWKYAAFAAVLGLAAWSSVASAQDAETVNPHPNPDKAHPVLHFLHLPTPGCWASHNGYSCGSFQSESVF